MASRETSVSEKTLDRAARYLSYQPRTRQELCRHLTDKGVPAAEADRCADLMEEYHLLDDQEYSRMYIETMLHRGRGMIRIRRDLQSKGVSREVIEDALLLLEDLPEESDMALAQAMDAVRGEDLLGMDHRSREKVKARIARRLAGRGFHSAVIYETVSRAIDQRIREQKEQE